jgi:hypothetical protein
MVMAMTPAVTRADDGPVSGCGRRPRRPCSPRPSGFRHHVHVGRDGHRGVEVGGCSRHSESRLLIDNSGRQTHLRCPRTCEFHAATVNSAQLGLCAPTLGLGLSADRAPFQSPKVTGRAEDPCDLTIDRSRRAKPRGEPSNFRRRPSCLPSARTQGCPVGPGILLDRLPGCSGGRCPSVR